MPDGFTNGVSGVPNPPPLPPPQRPGVVSNSLIKNSFNTKMTAKVNNKSVTPSNPGSNLDHRVSNETRLIAKVDAKSVGGGQGVMLSSINSAPRNPNLGMSTSEKPSMGDPQVRKLVYNMYRGLLSTKHDRANGILDSMPSTIVAEDEGVNARVRAMMRQQVELREGKMINLGPPPPPPPPPFSTGPPPVQPQKPSSENAANTRPVPPVNVVAPPAVLASAMMKEKKPFTYTPGGINLDEINDASSHQEPQYSSNTRQQVLSPSMQQQRSSGHNVNCNTKQEDIGGRGMTYEPKTFGGPHIPSRSFRILQAMTDTDEGVHSDESSTNRKGGSYYDIQQRSALKERVSPKSSESGFSLTSNDSSTKFTDQPDFSYNQVSSSSATMKQDASKTAKSNSPSYQNDSVPGVWQRKSNNSFIYPCANGDIPPKSNEIKTENNSSIPSNNMNGNDNKLIYGGNKIPSRLFKQLQNNFPNDQVQTFSTIGSKPSVDELLPQLTRNLNMTEKELENGRSTYGGSANMADASMHDRIAAKQSVLKELTSQFDPQTNLKKPRAAPGRVFHYLQQKYDENDTKSDSNCSSPNNISSCSIYVSDTPKSIIDKNYEIEPKPYNGSRIPGRTFKLLQANIDTHPSVLQARK